MSQPTSRGVHIDRPLTTLSVAYMQAATGFIATKVFPIVRVSKKSDLFRVYTKDDWFRDEAEERAPGTESAGGGYEIAQDSYLARVYSFHKDIADQDLANEDEDVDLDRGAVDFVSQRLLLKREKVFVQRAFGPGIWANEVTGVEAAPGAGEVLQWTDPNSDPRANIKAAKRQIKATTGYDANTLLLHYDVMDALADHPELIDRIKYTSRESITEAVLAQIFGVERVLVAGAIENRAKEGQAPANMDFVFGPHAWLGYVAPRPSRMAPSAGYTFSWDYAPLPQINENTNRVGVKRFRLEAIASERIEGEMAFDDKVVASDMGYFFEDIVAQPA